MKQKRFIQVIKQPAYAGKTDFIWHLACGYAFGAKDVLIIVKNDAEAKQRSQTWNLPSNVKFMGAKKAITFGRCKRGTCFDVILLDDFDLFTCIDGNPLDQIKTQYKTVAKPLTLIATKRS